MDFETIAAYLAGESNQQEKQEIEHWRQESTENEQNFQRWQLIWQASQKSNQVFKPDTTKAWQKINPANAVVKPFNPVQPATVSKNGNIFVWLRNLAAMFLLAIGLGWGIWQFNQTGNAQAVQWVEKTTVNDSTNEIVLPDGTKIWLNAHSKLRYPEQFTTKSREVFLDGEAYFEVRHRPQEPFRVHTQNSVTEVLGTSFNIRSYLDEPEVTVNLKSGKVSFRLENTLPDQKAMLKPGQKAILNKARQTITVIEDGNQNYLAWKTGQLIFQDVALREALQTLEDYYQVDFAVSDTLLLNCRFTGSFNQAPLADVLQVFAFGSDISYQKQGNQYLLSGAGCK
jgi:transmembrane sensor